MFKLNFKLIICLLTCLLFVYSGHAQQTQVLMIGTFHFENPGLDASKLKSLDIKSAAVQKEIDNIIAAIVKFKPQRILVEYPYQDQSKLDQLYQDFLANKITAGLNEKSEVYQLGFKSGKVLGLSRIDAIDYRMNLTGTDSVMKVMVESKQDQLMHAIPEYIKNISGNFNNLVQSGASLTDILLAQNTQTYRDADLGFYTNLLTKAGAPNNFIGADVATQWYKRNIYMYSLIQKKLTPDDQTVMILLGASHIAALEVFFKLNPAYKIVELKDVINK